MARKVTPSQLRSMLRQRQSNINQAIRKYNNAVDNYNRNMRRVVDNYNRAVREHNARVRQNRANIERELRKLNSSSNRTTVTTVYRTQYRSSSVQLNNSYNAVIATGDYLHDLTPQQARIYDLIEQENENNLATANAILSNEEPEVFTEHDMQIGSMLANISNDLDDRWKGAVFSLNPHNPDATRHFCTSAREIFTEAIELTAPDSKVFAADKDCEKTERGNATRRAKITYLLSSKGMDQTVIQFVDNDITNILELFHVLSDGTHGAAGKYSMEKLNLIKKRVEDGIIFLCNIAA